MILLYKEFWVIGSGQQKDGKCKIKSAKLQQKVQIIVFVYNLKMGIGVCFFPQRRL